MESYSPAPLVSVTVLRSECPRLVRDVKVENVLPGLKQFLSHDELEAIDASASTSSKASELIDILNRRVSRNSYEAFNAFMKILGGTQPELFTVLLGRSPTQAEADFCVEDYSNQLKRHIENKGHRTDSHLDEQIDLDHQHVQLQIVKSTPDQEGFEKTDTEALYLSPYDNQLPHEYQLHLLEMEKKGQNVSACDVLNTEKDQVKQVLLTGRAGVGKSTTLQWLARQWALGKWTTGFTVLFLLQLRMLSCTNTQMTALELLMLYGLFYTNGNGTESVLCAWLRNAADRVLLLFDGLDEISGFAARIQNTPRISKMNQKAHPMDLCINILRGDLLPGCTIISTSRPFTGLSALDFNNAFEILGLTKIQVKDFIKKKHSDKAKQIMSVLQRSPILMSVCGITFYCMAVSSLLSQGVELLDESIRTYTRLTAFIMVQYVSRKLSDWPFVIEVSSYFPKLARMAHMGIFQAGEDQGIARVAFNEYDLVEVQLNSPELNSIKKVGLLQIKEMIIDQRKSVVAEFLHLNVQELLAVAHLLSVTISSQSTLTNVFSSGQFNMALMYLFGLQYDTQCVWIKDVLRAVKRPDFSFPNDIHSHISAFLHRLCTEQRANSETKLKICQLVHEGHVEDQAKSVLDYVVPAGVLHIANTPMTAIDLMAVAFVCQYSETLAEITLKDVNGDSTFIEIMASSLLKDCSKGLQTLNVAFNNIGDEGAKALAERLQHSECLQTLDISGNNIGDDGTKAICQVLHRNKSLQTLHVSNNNISADGAKALAEVLQRNEILQTLYAPGNHIGDEGAKAFMEALQHNKSLQTLYIAKNNVGDRCSKDLAYLLCKRTKERLSGPRQ